MGGRAGGGLGLWKKAIIGPEESELRWVGIWGADVWSNAIKKAPFFISKASRICPKSSVTLKSQVIFQRTGHNHPILSKTMTRGWPEVASPPYHLTVATRTGTKRKSIFVLATTRNSQERVSKSMSDTIVHVAKWRHLKRKRTKEDSDSVKPWVLHCQVRQVQEPSKNYFMKHIQAFSVSPGCRPYGRVAVRLSPPNSAHSTLPTRRLPVYHLLLRNLFY